MTVILLIIGFFLLLVIKRTRIDETSRRMLNMFVVYWLVSMLLASIRVYDVYEVGSYTFFLVFLGVISFCVGYLFVAKQRSPNVELHKDDISKQVYTISDNVVYKVIMVIASIYIFTLLMVFFNKIIYYGTLSSVRTDFYAAELYGPLFAQVNAFILKPLYLVTLPVFVFQCLYKRSWFTIVLAFYLFGYESLGGGRIGYIRIVLCVVFIAYCLLQTFKSNKKRGYTLLILGSIVIFTLLTIVSAARMGEIDAGSKTRRIGMETTILHIVSYTSCPIVAFDHSLEYKYSELIGGYQYGNLTLTPVISAINLFTSRFGMTIPTSVTKLVEIKQNSPISVSPDIEWNALYTANLYFYNDFGVIGVVLFPLLFGILVSWLIGQLYKYRTLSLVMVLSFCFWCMMDSVLDLAFHSPYDFLTILIMYFVGTKRKFLLKK